MFSRKLVLLFSFFLLVEFSFAATNDDVQVESKQKKAKAAAAKMSKDDFKNYFKRTNQRSPKALDSLKMEKLTKKTSTTPQSSDAKKKVETQNGNLNLPSKMTYPGEYEEVQAALITWPYICLDSNGNYDKYIQVEQLFDGFGEYFDYTDYYNGTSNTYSYSTGKITSVIDLYDNSSNPPVFSALAHAIDENAEVWINIWHPADSAEIIKYMSDNGMPLKHARFFVNPGNSFWYRDCGPVAFYYGDQDSVAFMDFEYYGGRPLDDAIPVKIGAEAGFPVYTSTIEYEGGNILLDGLGNLFTSKAVYGTNQDKYGLYVKDSTQENGYYVQTKTALTATKIQDSLKYLLNLKNIKVLNQLQYDGGTGHIDLYADVYDENTMVFSQMPTAMSKFTDYSIVAKNVDTIMAFTKSDGNKYNKSYIPFPRKEDGSWYTSNDDYSNYTRTYSNHLFVNKGIVQPVFASSDSGDVDAMNADLDSLRAKYPGYTIYPIDIRSFDGYGGAIHCITKQIPVPNPLRIIHNPIVGTVASASSFAINSKVYNHSGVSTTTCLWRYKGATTWNTAVLSKSTDDSTVFAGAIPNTQSEGTIEYYLTATSNNGKSIVKPLTAPAGLYSFNFGTPSAVNEDNANSDRLGDFYPNPANESSTIKMNYSNASFDFQIIDASGKTVYSNNAQMESGYDAITINTKNFASGSYIALFKFSDGLTIQKKLVVVK